MDRIVVVGGCVAGLTAADTLREENFAGEIVVINAEAHVGYDRPPLSKKVLSGDLGPTDVSLKSAEFFSSRRIDHRVGTCATALDLRSHTLTLDSGESLAFDGLLIATGLRPRPLPQQPALAGLHMLRTVDQALNLREDLLRAGEVVVIGAGFLGCEIAATARQMGLQVALVDPVELPMASQLGPDLAAALLQVHRQHGVDIRCPRTVRGFEHKGGHVTGVTLDDGTQLPAQVVVVAIGSLPNTEWLRGSGLPLRDGVECDAFCCAAPGVYAAGDVASWRHPRFGVQMRLEHRMQATEQAMAAARNLLGAAIAYDPLPYFWTDFYDARIQVFGHIAASQEMQVLSGRMGEPGFTAAYCRDGVVEAVAGWNAAREIRKISALVGKPAPAPAAPVPG